MGYQSPYVALAIRGGGKNTLRRTKGTSSRGSEAARGQPTQRRKVGFCDCCARVMHIAAPVIYEAGEGDWLKSQAEEPWGRGGHATRRPVVTKIRMVRYLRIGVGQRKL